jgi:uncharacterized protein YhfF
MKRQADEYWNQFRNSLPAGAARPDRYVEAFFFGFTPEDATEIAALVIDGKKTATGSVLWSCEADGKPISSAGDYSIVMNGDQDPVCIVRTTEVSIIPFDEVPEEYAREGAEGDLTLATWRPMYWQYIEMECERIGREPSSKAPLVMERFGVVYAERFEKNA